MKLITRYIILFIFFVIFIISATILLKYASGYRYDFKKNIWQKTGILVLKSNPKDASIFLNGELQKEKTPTKIMNLFPGDYLIKLQKTGFSDWQKKITINPNSTTFAQNIILFKKDQIPILLSDKNIEFFKLSPNEKEIIYSTKNKMGLDLWLYNFNTKEEKKLNHLSSMQIIKINNLSFSSSEKKILIEGNNDLEKTNYLILNLEKPKEIISLNLFAPNIQNIKWHFENDKILYGITKINNASSLIQINLKDKKIIPIISKTTNILDYYFDKKFIYYLTLNSKNNVSLKKIDKNNFSLISEEITQLPFSSYSFVFSPKDILTILDKKNQLLYLISFHSEYQFKTQKIILDAKDVSWSKNGEKILYYNDFELWICYLNSEKLKESSYELLGRWTQKISKAIWHPQENYIIFTLLNKDADKVNNNKSVAIDDSKMPTNNTYLTGFVSDDSINAIEIDSRDQKNIAPLLKSEKIKDLFFSSKDKILYFIKEEKEENKLYEMEIY
ncbi:MAG: PEGA domain-containing protein [Candidatus Kuenenbacteria bacterium]